MLRLLATLLFCVLVLESNPIRSEIGVSSEQNEATLQRGEASNASPVYFTKNMGQWPDSILFRADAGGATIWIAKNSIYYQFTRSIRRDSENSHSDDLLARQSRESGNPVASGPDSLEIMMVKASFVDANPNVQVESDGIREFKFNYFLGNDPTKWATDVPSFAAVTLHGVYEGVDLRFYGGEGGGLAYTFKLSPGSDPDRIQVEYEGIEPKSIDATGTISAQRGWETIKGVLAKPAAMTSSAEFTFGESAATAAEDLLEARSPQAVQLIYSTYLGGTSNEHGKSITVDTSGNVYVAGSTTSADFPVQNPYDGSYNGGSSIGDVFISKLSSSGNTLLYSTYLGGTGDEFGFSIAIDSSGNAYLTGYTASIDFPLQNPLDASPSPVGDAFVTKLASSGNNLLYSTYLGGNGNEYGYGIAVDSSGNAYVTGYTESSDFPTLNPYDGSSNGFADAFVSKLSASGNTLLYSTYLGGSDGDDAYEITVDAGGNAYVTGRTFSVDFPSQNSFDASHNGGSDAFVSKLSSSGNTLLYSTYLGGASTEVGNSIAVDASGNAYVTGITWSADFPVQSPFNGSSSSAPDAFVSKLSSSGNALLYSTYLGGGGQDEGYGISIDATGNAYVMGLTRSVDFPTEDSYDASQNGGIDVFVSKFAAVGNALHYSTFLGGTNDDYGFSIAIDADGNAYVTGQTVSTNFPVQNAFDGSFNGSSDVFVTAISRCTGPDFDLDEVKDICDNCPDTPNGGQQDSDFDGIGDACESCYGISPISWSIGNQASSMWPSSHWNQFSYCTQPTPCGECCINCASSDFPDWTTFASLIGSSEAYFDPPPGAVRYRPSALNQWRAVKGPWKGSCYGFAATYYLYLDGFRSLATDFPGSADLMQVPLNALSRNLINQYYVYQYGFEQQKKISTQLENITPSQTLIDCQDMYTEIPRNDRVMMMFNQNGTGAHAVAPYRCFQDLTVPTTWYLYVHDSNFPADTTKRIAINTVSNTWSYSGQPGWGGDKGLFLVDTVSSYMGPLEMEDATAVPQVLTIYFGDTDSATFVTPTFGAFGFSVDSLFGEIPGSYPIIPADGQETSPIGYFLPTAYYNWQIVGVESGQCIINYGDNIQWRVGGAKAGIISAAVTAAAQNVNVYAGAAKNLQDMLAVCDTQYVELLIIEPDSEMVIRIEDIDIAPGDSVRFSIVSASAIQVDNYGSASNYDLSVQIVSASADDRFYHADIPITQNTAHTIHFDWRQSNDSVDIDVDVDRNGSIDSILIVSDQATPMFFCGDADGNSIVTISDAVFLINYIFSGGPAPSPIVAGDADCNSIVTISDAVYLINYIFAGGPSPCSSCP